MYFFVSPFLETALLQIAFCFESKSKVRQWLNLNLFNQVHNLFQAPNVVRNPRLGLRRSIFWLILSGRCG
jgi:hypothetical protein